MNIIICDDMKNESDKLAGLLCDSGCAPVIFSNGYDVLDYIDTGAAVDACFLDILMPEMSGVILADKLRAGGFSGAIIFLSSSNEFAQESYKVKAFSYLLKPPTLESVRDVLRELDKARKEADNKGIAVNTRNITRFIKFYELSHVEVIQHNVYFRLTNGDEVKVYAAFSEFAPLLLRDKRFVQCHRSYIVNMSDVDYIADQEITMRSGTRIPISKAYTNTRNIYLKWAFEKDKN